MSAATDTKQERINLRLKCSSKRALEHAASLEGKTVSHFILASALAQAEKTIHEHEVVSLSQRDSAAFFDALTKPIVFNEKLLAAFKKHDKRVAGQ